MRKKDEVEAMETVKASDGSGQKSTQYNLNFKQAFRFKKKTEA